MENIKNTNHKKRNRSKHNLKNKIQKEEEKHTKKNKKSKIKVCRKQKNQKQRKNTEKNFQKQTPKKESGRKKEFKKRRAVWRACVGVRVSVEIRYMEVLVFYASGSDASPARAFP